jgi:hypothetical protein
MSPSKAVAPPEPATTDPLSAAHRASSEMPARSPDATVAPCPLTKRYAIEVLVVGVDGVAVDGIGVRLAKSPQEVSGRVSAADGPVRFDGLLHAEYDITFPNLDRDAWKLLCLESLTSIEQKSEGDIQWTAPAPAEDADATYLAAPGDCLSNIAFKKGFAPGTIWQDASNESLRGKRKSGYILLPGDIVGIPKKRPAAVSVSTGQRCIVQLISVPETLRIRFLTYTRRPRAGVPYLLHIETDRGDVLPARKGQTNGDGFLIEPIPPSAISGEICLGQGIHCELIPIHLGYVDPIDDVRGLQARLDDLNYPCGIEDGEFGELTRQALRSFQKEHDLRVTGERDSATVARLESMFLS